MDPILAQINKATGYTPNMGVGGSNGGRVYAPAPSAQQTAAASLPYSPQSLGSSYDSQLADALRGQTAAIYAQINNQARPNTSFNIMGNYQTALQQAHSSVDPFYNKMINEFNQQMDTQNQLAQQQDSLTTDALKQALQNQVQSNQIAGQRVGEDTSTALGNLANYQQNYKSTEGMAFDQAQRSLGANLGTAGTATSGVGQQAVQQAQTQEALGQQAQGQQYQTQRQGEQLFANRSFEDLSRSTDIAGQQEGIGEKQATYDLNKSLAGIAAQRQQQNNQYEIQRQSALISSQQQNYQNLLNGFLSNLKGRPQDILATKQFYG